jgi:hypothetical protein
MATFGIESNGRLEKTAVYFNGEQLGGVKEIFLNLDETGTFDAIIQYEGTDKNLYTKQLFLDYLDNVKITDPSFTEEDAADLQLLEVESNGDINNTTVNFNRETLSGIVSIFVHIKAPQVKHGIRSYFENKSNIPDTVEFKAEITFRNEDDTLTTEAVY